MTNFEQPDRPLPGAPWDHHEDYWRRIFTRTISFVYVIQAERGAIKVGVAKNPATRLRSHQTSNHELLTIRHVMPGDEFLESQCHSRIRHGRIRGEWFSRNVAYDFMRWFAAEEERLIDVYEESGEKPTFGEYRDIYVNSEVASIGNLPRTQRLGRKADPVSMDRTGPPRPSPDPQRPTFLTSDGDRPWNGSLPDWADKDAA